MRKPRSAQRSIEERITANLQRPQRDLLSELEMEVLKDLKAQLSRASGIRLFNREDG
jgi:hypothetical protein